MAKCPIFQIALLAAFCASAAPSALPGDRIALAREFSRRGLHDEALKELESLASVPGGVPADELAYRLGEEYRALGRNAESIAQSRLILEKHPQSRYADYARLAVALASGGETRRKLLEPLDSSKVPAAVRNAARYHLAAYRAQSEDPAERRRALAAYLDLAGSGDKRLVEESLFFAGMISYKDARYGEAATIFDRLIAAAGADAPYARKARSYAAWSNHLAGRPARALELSGGAGAGGDEDAAYLKAASLRALGRSDEALAAFDAALKAFPAGRHAGTEWMERLALLAAKGDSRTVLAELEKRGDPPAANAARAFTIGYEAASALGDSRKALEYAHRAAAAADPGSTLAQRARYMAGVFAARAGNGSEAVRTWSALLAESPDSPFAADALKARAIEEIRAKSFKAANRSMDELARRFPAKAQDAQTLYWRGVAARGSDDLPEAGKLFDAALAAKPSPEFAREINLERAYLLQKKGDRAGAARAMAEILGTKAAERLPDGELAWLAETSLAEDMTDAALSAAETLEKRTADAAWRQIAAELVSEALERKGMADAAEAACRRALAADARTSRGAMAALRLGLREMETGRNEAAAKTLADAVERSQGESLDSVRMKAYAALAKNEDARGDEKTALGYYMLVSTLFDDRETVPPAMKRAVEILRRQGKAKEADELAADMGKRYGL